MALPSSTSTPATLGQSASHSLFAAIMASAVLRDRGVKNELFFARKRVRAGVNSPNDTFDIKLTVSERDRTVAYAVTEASYAKSERSFGGLASAVTSASSPVIIAAAPGSLAAAPAI